jgi:hypothetical protein
LPSDIKDAIFQDQVASSLLGDQVDESQSEEVSSDAVTLNVDSGDGEYSESELQTESEDGAENEIPEESLEAPTPEEQEAWIGENQAFEALPERQQFEQCSDLLSQQYAQVQAELDPETAQAWVEKLVADTGFGGLEHNFDAVAVATVAEAASSNFETTLRYHPDAPAFQEAAGRYYELSPDQRQSAEGQRRYAAAVQAAMPLNSRTMSLAVLNDLGVGLRFPDLVNSGNPVALISQLVVDMAEDAGWLTQQPDRQSRQGAGRSPFQTNQDLFDAESMEEIARRGLL